MKLKNLFIMLLLALMPVTVFAASNPGFAGPNNGQVTVTNSSTTITPVPFPGRFSIEFSSTAETSTTAAIYICQATQKDSTTGFPSATLKTCSSSVADIVLLPQTVHTEHPNGYTGQYTAITSIGAATLVIHEN